MSVAPPADTARRTHAAGDEQTLKPNAIGFLDSLVIGLASTAPAYTLAAIIGSLVVVVGVQAPGALLLSFVPMFLIAGAFFYMNRADPDAGTTFSWVTRTLGPWVGWIGGWAVCVTGILVIGSLADVGARYTYLLFGADGAAVSKAAVTVLAVAYIAVMTVICTVLARIHGRFRTPHVATAAVAVLATAWYVPANLISENFLFDSLSALALMIAFYYALSGIACLVYYRRELGRSAWNTLVMGVGPTIGAVSLAYLFVEASRSLSSLDASYTGQKLLGFAPPLTIGYGFLLLGVVLVVVWRLADGGDRFFARRAWEAVDPDVAAGRAKVQEAS